MNDKKERPLILVSNDDGYESKGISELVKVAREFGEVWVVAPSTHQSGKASAITFGEMLRIKEVKSQWEDVKMFRVSGTPADSVKLALNCVLPHRPDLILSGINHGYNPGNCVIYSGTMGVVLEGCIVGIPSVGFSYEALEDDADFAPCLPAVKQVIKSALECGLPDGVCLNVNIPKPLDGKELPRELKTTVPAKSHWDKEYLVQKDPYGRTYYWLAGDFVNDEPEKDTTDLYWLKRGYVSVTPCHVDQTDYAALSHVKDMLQG